MASVSLLRNLIKKYRIGKKTTPAAPAGKESIAKANTKHAAVPKFKSWDSDDEKPLQFSQAKSNIIAPSQSAAKHKGFPKFKSWDSDDEEPLQIPRVKHVTAPPQHHDTHKHTKSLGSLLQKPKKETSGILPKGNKYGYPQSDFSDASDSDTHAVDDVHAAAPVAAAPVAAAPVAAAPVAADVPKLESPVADPVTPVVKKVNKTAALTKDNVFEKIMAVPDDAPKTLRPKRLPVTVRKEKARQVEELAAKMRTAGPKLKSGDDLEIKEEIQPGAPITAKKIQGVIAEVEMDDGFDADKTAPKKKHTTPAKNWFKTNDMTFDTSDFKGDVFDAPEASLPKTKDGVYSLNLNPSKATLLNEATANTNVVKSMFHQYKLAAAAAEKSGISHYFVNGRPIVAVRDFTIRGEGSGQVTPQKMIQNYLIKHNIYDGVYGRNYNKIAAGNRSNYIVMGITEKPPPYNVWKAAMQKKFGKNADILPEKI